jgi:hypothetical protein
LRRRANNGSVISCVNEGAKQRRHALRDEDRGRIEHLLPGKATDPGVTAPTPTPPAREKSDRTGGQEEQALGKSRGGFGTKIHGAVTGLGLPAVLKLTAGQEADVSSAKDLLEGVPPGAEVKAVMADKAYDSKEVVELIQAMGAEAVIPTLSARKEQREIDRGGPRFR